MRDFILIRPWRVVPVKDVVRFLEILKELPPEPAEESLIRDRQMIN